MQTFLPVPDFSESARLLDRQRLGKQRVEALQILHTLQGTSKGWQHHPAVRMWRGCEQALALYGQCVCSEWVHRGYQDTCREHFDFALDNLIIPLWFGSKDFHRSHQSNLVRKFPEHYRPFFPDVPDNLPYVWPGAVIAKEV